VKMQLGTAGMGIFAVLPVDDKNPHYSRPARRA
jgi:hypothetical protein